MISDLEALHIDFGHLKLSDKESIRNYIRIHNQNNNSFNAESPEVDYLVKKLMEVYNAEKGAVGNDRLYSVGREVSSLFKETELLEFLVANILLKLRSKYRRKKSGKKNHSFYIGKAKSLMAGFGPDTSNKFEEIIKTRQKIT